MLLLILFLLADTVFGLVCLVALCLVLAKLRAINLYSSRVIRFELVVPRRPSMICTPRGILAYLYWSTRMQANVGDVKKLVATNFKDAAGVPVDVDANPTAFTGLTFEVDDGSKADLAAVDARTVAVTLKGAGTVTITARAKNVNGEDVVAIFVFEAVDVAPPPPPPVPVVTSFELQPVE
jgi:hypothetical protein